MKDNAATGIENAKQSGQLRKDAAVHSRKDNAQKRGNYGSNLSSSASNSSKSINEVNSNTTSRSSSGSQNVMGTTRRTDNNQKVDKAIKIAKRIPVAQKYAKMAEKIQKIRNSRVGNFFGNVVSMAGNKPDVSADDVEEAAAAEQAGEEYKPDAAEARYTAITMQQMKYLAIFMCVGIVGGAIFFCVIMVSSLTDSGGQAYLASKSNPTEDELGEWYSAQSGDDSNSNNSSDSGSNYTGTSTTSSTAPVPIKKTGNSTIDKINEIAASEATNKVGAEKYQEWFGFYGDWCAIFVSWLFDQVDGLDKYYVKNGSAGPGARTSISRGYGTWLEDECTDSKTVPKAGDVLHLYPCNPGDACYVDQYSSGHVGYVYAVDDKNIYTVEGNNDPNKVVFVTHERKDCQINGYYRPNY